MLRRILIELAKMVAPVAVLFGLLLCVSWHAFPPETERTLDSSRAPASFLATQPAYVTFHGTALAGGRPALMLIGASNTSVGFRPQHLAPLLDGRDIHNLAVNGSNIDGMRAAVELVYANRPPDQRGDLVLVLGLWYGMFLHFESNVGQTPVANQLRRFGLYQAVGEGFERRLSPADFDFVVNLLRPVFLIQTGLGGQGPVAKWLFPDAGNSGAAAAAAAFIPPSMDTRDFPLPSAQFDALEALARRVEEMGGRLVLVDLPLPKIAAGNAPLWQRYQVVKQGPFERARSHGAIVIDMQDMNCDCDFDGGTHPRDDVTPRWSARLAAELKKAGLVR